MLSLLKKIVEWFAKLNPLLLTAATGTGVVISVWEFGKLMWADLFARIDALVVPSTSGTADFSPLGLANYVFPLDTMLTYLGLLMGLKVVCVAIRIIKSFVPTVS